ncbi:carbohydrate ABC transporter permease [Kribbella sp. VKM Ac-2568]|uniref:carbohydrate ABC transporter permease n=1 Tax=Kribbella sp. VKM Ac-2568 TaxID=2512219 RepID=UPI001047FAB2|nr:sugar ABC transporter permease [Kribbella sp. VKM Ac-2568]TCM45690.1 multiple sugar transport system permease protein [Kribbella sp. VKM Ac-2568]
MTVQASAGAVRRRRTRTSTAVRGYGRATPYLFLAPYLVLFLLFVIGPAIFGFWMSLHDWDFQLPGKPFVGLQNYKDLFDPLSATAEPFWHSMRATGIFTVASVPFLVGLPLGLAVLLNRKFPGRTFFRAVYFAPFVLGVAVIGLMFRYILDTSFGILNAFLGLFGISEIGWTTEQPWAFVALVAVTVWWTAGFNSIIYLAGLQDIPPEQYEAAELDGANGWQKFRNVTLPGLRPVTVFIVIITLLASANMFGQSVLITQGGPGDTTTTALMVITDTGFSQFRMGQATAMSYLLALCLAVVALVVFAVVRERKS